MHFLKMTPNKKFPLLRCTCIQWPYTKLVATNVSNPITEWPGLWGNQYKNIKIDLFLMCVEDTVNNVDVDDGHTMGIQVMYIMDT